MFTPGGQAFLGSLVSGIYTGVTGAATIAGMSGGLYTAGMAAVSGTMMGGLSAALAGGSLGDVLRGAVIGGISGALTGYCKGVDGLAGLVGQGVVGGATNEAMGGKFQDGFLSAAAAAAAQMTPIGEGNPVTGLIKASVVGGTASALGGGKFANGAYTAAFQYVITGTIKSYGEGNSAAVGADQTALDYAGDVYSRTDGGDLGSLGIDYQDNVNDLGAAFYSDPSGRNYLAFRGTNSLPDWKDNILQALGFHTPQYDMAVQLARDVFSKTNGNVIFVGHSLGGGLASAAAGATGGSAITFNAAGLGSTYRGHPGSIAAGYIRGDILSQGQDFTFLSNAAGTRNSFPGHGNPIDRHGWKQFLGQ
jgi:hypothetical protein